jgi:uridine kinase
MNDTRAERDADIGLLRESRILATISDEELGLLWAALTQSVVKAGTDVVHEGDDADGMFFVLEGRADVLRGTLELGELGPSDHFGELGLLGLRPRAATVRAQTAVRLGRLSRGTWLRLSADHPKLALKILQQVVGTLGDQLVRATDSVGLLLGQRSLPRRTSIVVEVLGESRSVAPGTPVGAVLPKRHDGAPVIAAMLDERPVALETPLVSESTVAPLTGAMFEGRDVLRRSAGLALLEVAHELYPEEVFRLGGTIGGHQIVETSCQEPSASLAEALDAGLLASIKRGTPFREEWWSTEEAADQLRQQGWRDGAGMLQLSRESTVGLVSVGRSYAIRTGPLLHKTSDLTGVQVVSEQGRLFLRFEHAASEELAAEIRAPRFDSEMTRAGRKWLARLGVTDVASFDELCIAGRVSRIIRPAESFHEKRIAALADAIAARTDSLRVICVAGPSSSGKTTFLRRLSVQLEVNGVLPVGLSLDDYYVDREHTPRDEKGDYDFEALEALQLERLQRDVAALLAGREVTLPRYDFASGRSLVHAGPPLSLGRDMVLVIEGIHALNPRLLGSSVPDAAQFRIFVHPATVLAMDRLSSVSPLDVRLLRRIVRDRHGRSFDAANTIQRWPSVRRGERHHIYPHLPRADAVFDTFLAYEISVLKIYAERYLMEVPRQHPSYATAWRLRQLIDRFVAIHPDHVPPTSLLREFIGGSGFEY